MRSGSKRRGGSDDGDGIREAQTGGVGEFEIGSEQLRVGGIYVYGAIQMQAAGVLIADADFPGAGNFALNRQIALLGVREFEIFRDGKSEGQDRERESRGEIILVGEKRTGKERIETLLVRQISHVGESVQDTLENGRTVQIIGRIEAVAAGRSDESARRGRSSGG